MLSLIILSLKVIFIVATTKITAENNLLFLKLQLIGVKDNLMFELMIPMKTIYNDTNCVGKLDFESRNK